MARQCRGPPTWCWECLLGCQRRQAAELLRAGRTFDFLFLRHGEPAPAGYDEVRRVLETGEVEIE